MQAENKELFEKAIDHLHDTLSTIRTNRATPALVEKLSIRAYDATSPLIELASITVPEPQSLLIQPWDPSICKDIEKAIQESPLGINPINDGKSIRLVMPSLTTERREQLMKVVGQKSEEAKIAIRNIRESQMKLLKKQEQDGALSEDAVKLEQKKLQESVNEATQEVEKIITAKEQELSS